MAAAGSEQDLDTAFDAILGQLSASAAKAHALAPATPEPAKPAPKPPKASFEEIDALTSALLNPIVIKKAAAGSRPPPAGPNPRSPRPEAPHAASPRAPASPRPQPQDAAPSVPPLTPISATVSSPRGPAVPHTPPDVMMSSPSATNGSGLPPPDFLPPPSFLSSPPPPPPVEVENTVTNLTLPTTAVPARTPSPGRAGAVAAAPVVHSSALNKWLAKGSTYKAPASPDTSVKTLVDGPPVRATPLIPTSSSSPAVSTISHTSPSTPSPAIPVSASTATLSASHSGAAAPAPQPKSISEVPPEPVRPAVAKTLITPTAAPTPPAAKQLVSPMSPSPPANAVSKQLVAVEPTPPTLSSPATVQPASPALIKQPVRPTSALENSQPPVRPNGMLSKSMSNTSLAVHQVPVVMAANKEELALHEAVKSGQQTRVMEVLAKNKGLINVRNTSEQSPLHVAAQLGHQEIVNLLIANGAQLDAVDRSNWAAIHYAGAGGHLATCRLLITAGASVGVRNDVGCTVLHYLMACGVSKPEKPLFRIVILEVVRAPGFDMNVRNNSGATGAHQAAFRGKRWNLKVLLVHNPDMSVQTKLGETPLHFAARRGDAKMVQMMLNKGADPNVKAETGTALDIAHAFKHDTIVAILTPVTKVPLTAVDASYDDLWRSQSNLSLSESTKKAAAGSNASVSGAATNGESPKESARKNPTRLAVEAPASPDSSAVSPREKTSPRSPRDEKDKKDKTLGRRLSTIFTRKEEHDAIRSSPSSPGAGAPESHLSPHEERKSRSISKRLSMAIFSDDKEKKEKKQEPKKDDKKEKKEKEDKEKKEKEEKEKKEREKREKDEKEKKEKEEKERKEKEKKASVSSPVATPASPPSVTVSSPSGSASSPASAADSDTLRRMKRGVLGSISQAFETVKSAAPGGHTSSNKEELVISSPTVVSTSIDVESRGTMKPVEPTVPSLRASTSNAPAPSSGTPPATPSVSSTATTTPAPTPSAAPASTAPVATPSSSPPASASPVSTAPTQLAPVLPAVSQPTGSPTMEKRSPKPLAKMTSFGQSPRPGVSMVDSLFSAFDPHERELMIASPQFKRTKVVEEIINTEREYVSDLEALITLFLVPLRNKNLIHFTDVSDIFSNVETIYDVNTKLLASLTKGDPIGSAFLNMSENLKTYSVFMANQDHSTASLERCKKTYPELGPFLASVFDANSQLRNTNLDNMLIKPVQRICKYPLLLDQLQKYTSPVDPDYQNVENAKLAIEKVCEYIDVKILEYASRMKLQEIEPQMADLPEGFSIVPPEGAKQRQYIKEWECRVSSKNDTRPSKVYLFDDMLVWTAAGLLDNMVGRNKKKNRYRDHVPFTEMLIKEVNGAIVITHVGVREFSLNPESEFDKEQWKNDIERAADDVLKRNYNDIYGAIPESDRVSFTDYKKNLQRQLEFIPLPVEVAKRGVSTRKENEVFALGSVAMPTDAAATGTAGGSAIYTSKRENSPPRMPAPASLPGGLTVPQVQAAAARSSSPKRAALPAPPPKAKNPLPTSASGQVVQQEVVVDAGTAEEEEVLEAR